MTSFVAGVDFIKSIINESDDTLSSTQCHSIKQSLQTITDTNAFMLMTINRCIDYAKATKGIKLVPRLETIDLWETMQLPLTCMRNVQDRVSIVMQSMPSEVCSHVITDKQWLQENLLCLLSNAVKYTSQGNVTLSMTMLQLPGSYQPVSPTGSSKSFSIHFGGASISSRAPNDVAPSDADCVSSEIDADIENGERSDHISKDAFPTQFLLFEVEDNGIGVPPELMDSLFRPFKQTQRLAGGTGLGLYSLAKRIEAIHGEYGVRGRKDGKKGSVFWFTIPYRPDEVTAAANKLPASSLSGKTNKDDESDKTMVGEGNLKSIHTAAGPISLHVNTSIFSMDFEDAIFIDTQLGGSKSPTMSTEAVTTMHLEPVVSTSDSSHQPLLPLVATSFISAATTKVSSTTNVPIEKSEIVGLQILLIEDSLPILKMTSMILKKSGHIVTTAENGEVALRIVEDRWERYRDIFDVILTDLQMPVMDGLEATKRLRQMEKNSIDDPMPPLLIIGVSANSDNETAITAFDSGINAFISKPFALETFNQVVASVLKQSLLENPVILDYSEGNSLQRRDQFLKLLH